MQTNIIHKEKKDWDLNAKFYAKIADSPYQKFFDQLIWKNYQINPTGSVLEIGAGAGNFARLLKKPFFTDFSQEMIIAARKRVKGQGIVCSAHQLPFKNKQFKVIFTNDTLHHLKGQLLLEKSIIEIYRVATSDACLCINDRAPSLAGNGSVLLFNFLKKIVVKLIGNSPSCGSSTEPTFTKNDYNLLKKYWTFEKVIYWRTLPTYLLTVFTHQLGIYGKWNSCFKLQRMTLGLIELLETYFAWPFWCTEVSIKAKRRL